MRVRRGVEILARRRRKRTRFSASDSEKPQEDTKSIAELHFWTFRIVLVVSGCFSNCDSSTHCSCVYQKVGELQV